MLKLGKLLVLSHNPTLTIPDVTQLQKVRTLVARKEVGAGGSDWAQKGNRKDPRDGNVQCSDCTLTLARGSGSA